MRPPSSLSPALGLALTILMAPLGRPSTPADITIDRHGVLLKGKFYVAEGDGPFPTVVLLHGFPGNEMDVLGLGGKLSKEGINALTFHYSGTHQSQGEYSFGDTQKDIRAAFELIHRSENVSRYRIDTTRIYLGGYSYGGGMALTYAANHPEITTVFSIAGTDHGEFMREYFRNREFAVMIDAMFEELNAPSGPVRFAKGATPKETTPEIIAESDSTIDLRKSAPLLAPKDILLVGGWDDPNVTIDHHILPLYRALQNEKAKNVKIVAFQDDHSFRNSRAELARMIIDWLKSAPEREKS